MVMCAMGIKQGTTRRRLVMINAMMIQLYQPLNFMAWSIARSSSVIDIVPCSPFSRDEARDRGQADAKPLEISAGTSASRNITSPTSPIGKFSRGSHSMSRPPYRRGSRPFGAASRRSRVLLFRFYEVTGGRISIDGQDIRDVTQKSLRSAIGMVPQDTVLFNDTIATHPLRRWEASNRRSRKRRALRRSTTSSVCRRKATRPKWASGLEALGGEKQRVAIARTILKGPPILLLDEAPRRSTPHRTEIQDALDRVSRIARRWYRASALDHHRRGRHIVLIRA